MHIEQPVHTEPHSKNVSYVVVEEHQPETVEYTPYVESTQHVSYVEPTHHEVSYVEVK